MAYAGDHVEESAVRDAVGLADEEAVGGLLDAYVAGDAPAALQRIADLSDAGRDLGQVAQQLEAEGRRRLLASPGDPALARRLAAVLRATSEAGSSGAREGRARLHLELLAVDSGHAATPTIPATPVAVTASAAAQAPPRREPAPRAAAPSASPPPEKVEAPPATAAAPQGPATPAVLPNGERPSLDAVRARWGEVADRASPAIKPLIKECRPYELDGARLTLAFPEGREFLRSRVAERSRSIEELLGQMFGGSWAVECVAAAVDLEPLSVEQALDPGESPDANALLQRTLEITGGQLVDVPEVRT
jgi:hypothetical protein